MYRWREPVLAVALISLGVGIAASSLIMSLSPSAWAPMLASAVLAIAFVVPVVWALSRSRPATLLRFRPVDLLYGVVLGALLRVSQGWIALALGDDGALPSYVRVGDALPDGWLFTEGLWVVALAPVAEELFFRGVIMVSVFTLLRRRFGGRVAGFVAVMVSMALFVVVHTVTGALSADQVIAVVLLGLVCALLVMCTGRVWGAVLTHACFNASYVALALVGTYWG